MISFGPCGCRDLNLTLGGDVAKCKCRSLALYDDFFGIFAGSPKRWEILKAKVPSLAVKRGGNVGCRALKQYAVKRVVDDCSDPQTTSEAKLLANEMQSFEFILSTVIRYDILTLVE